MAMAGQIAAVLMLATAESAGPLPPGEVDALEMLQQSQWACPVEGDALEADDVFDCLARRYRGLDSYSDVTQAVCEQTGGGNSDESSRFEMRLDCEIRGGKLTVTLPREQMRKLTGLDLPVAVPARLARLWRAYQLWLAPHMMMHESETPLAEMLAGGAQGGGETLEAVRVQSVLVDERPMVHLQLKAPSMSDAGATKSNAGGGQGVDAAAAAGRDADAASFIDLFVNPRSMLIERVEAQRTLPDGRTWRTRLEITPREDEGTAVPDAAEKPTPREAERPDVPPDAPATVSPERGLAAVLSPA
jgi:hypothetical protein